MIRITGTLSSWMIVVLLLVGVIVESVSGGTPPPKWYETTYEQFVPYGPEDQLLLEMQDTNLEVVAPQVSIISSIPESESPQYGFIWPIIEGLAIRNADSKIMNLQPVYMMKHGLEMGCRMHRDDSGGSSSSISGMNGTDDNNMDHPYGGEDHIPIDSPICDDHCTHHGRYCPAELPYDLAGKTKYHGKDLILEIVRRLCFGSVLEGTYANHLWFQYLRQFDAHNCLEGGDDDKPLKQCSEDIISSITTDEKQIDNMMKCVADADAETDTPNAMLEKQLQLLQDVQYTWDELPVLDMNGQKVLPENNRYFRADSITRSWCSFFPEATEELPAEYDPAHPIVTRPISCDFCSHCNRVENCLWFDRCDSHQFDLATFHDPKGKNKAVVVEKVEEVAEEVVEDTEVVVEDVTIGIMYAAAGAAVGATVVLLICAIHNRHRRKKAIDEVANELPVERYQDEENIH